jgi:hypothetical protein
MTDRGSAELQTPHGKPIDGFALADCGEIYGDQLDRTVAWKGKNDVSRLAGTPVRLHFVLKDADLYSIQFRPLTETPCTRSASLSSLSCSRAIPSRRSDSLQVDTCGSAEYLDRMGRT